MELLSTEQKLEIAIRTLENIKKKYSDAKNAESEDANSFLLGFCIGTAHETLERIKDKEK